MSRLTVGAPPHPARAIATAIAALLEHSPERHMRRVAVAGHVERHPSERIGLQLE